jgi:hypothetical protein
MIHQIFGGNILKVSKSVTLDLKDVINVMERIKMVNPLI